MAHGEAQCSRSFFNKAKENLRKLRRGSSNNPVLENTIRELVRKLQRQREQHAQEQRHALQRERSFVSEIQSIARAFKRQRTENLEGWRRERDAWHAWVERLRATNREEQEGFWDGTDPGAAEPHACRREQELSAEVEAMREAFAQQLSARDQRERELQAEIEDMKEMFTNQLVLRELREKELQAEVEEKKEALLLLQLIKRSKRDVDGDAHQAAQRQKGQHAEEQQKALEREEALCAELYCMTDALLLKENRAKAYKRERHEMGDRLQRMKEQQTEELREALQREKTLADRIQSFARAVKRQKMENLEGWRRERRAWSQWVEHLRASCGGGGRRDEAGAAGTASETGGEQCAQMEAMREAFTQQLRARDLRERELLAEIEEMKERFANQLSLRDLRERELQAEVEEIKEELLLLQLNKKSKNNIVQNFFKKLRDGQRAEAQWQTLEREMAVIADLKRIISLMKDKQADG